MRRILPALGAALAATIWAASPALAGMDGPVPVAPRKAPGLVISFHGGLAGQNIFQTLDAVTRSGVPIPTEAVAVEPNDTLCGMLIRRGLPPDCLAGVKFVESLNAETRPIGSTLRVGDTVHLPKLELDRYQAVDNFTTSHAQVAEYGRAISKRYRDARLTEKEGFFSVDYPSYELYVAAESDQQVKDLTARIYALKLDNVAIDALTTAEAPARLHSFTSDHVRDLCETDAMAAQSFDYASLVEADTDAAAVVRREPAATDRTVSVWLIDTRLAKSPNLWPAFGDAEPQGGWRCRWRRFVIGDHHATHLASIIASQANTFGFKGLAPGAKLNNFVWVAPDPNGNLQRSDADRARLLAHTMRREPRDLPLRVWLAATNFDPLIEGEPKDDLPEEFAHLRTNGSQLLVTIARNRPLLIVAAGQQSDKRMAGAEIHPRLNVSPQNLGDIENVVVVTACEDCRAGSERIMPSANRTRKGEYMVHVAAPGGENVAGWISESEIGESSGTSQAAAFVAGVAASMISRYPEVYRTPDTVKLRLQAISRPLSWKNGLANRDAERLTAGVVDPLLALLDPSKNWVKDGQGWRAVKIKSWPASGVAFEKESGSRTAAFEDRHILRMARTPFGARKRWSVYLDRYELDPNNLFTSVERLDLVTPLSGAALTLCDGSSLPFDSLDDAVFKMGPAVDACGDAVSARVSP
jgi:subtilisin family serine protease